jgi:hypothetical protein
VVQIAAPLICIVTLVTPVTVSVSWFIAAALGYFVATGALTWVYSRGAMHAIHNEAYSYAAHPAQLAGMYGLVEVQRKFVSARKSGARSERTWVRWYLWLLATVSLAGAAFGIGRLVAGNHSQAAIWSTFFIILNEFWMLWFLVHLFVYERRSRHLTPPPYQKLTGLARYEYILGQFTGPYVMPSGVVVDRPVKTSRVRPGRLPGTVETRTFGYEAASPPATAS